MIYTLEWFNGSNISFKDLTLECLIQIKVVISDRNPFKYKVQNALTLKKLNKHKSYLKL